MIITREIPADGCRPALHPGSIVYRCIKPTYGCIDSSRQVAATLDPHGGYPFFDVPLDAIAGDQ